jgi:hypothetical protein
MQISEAKFQIYSGYLRETPDGQFSIMLRGLWL